MNPFEKRLAEAVREHPHLYDHTLRDYRLDTQRTQDSWREIADALDSTEDNVRLKWKNLRDKFSKAKKRMVKRKDALTNGEKPVPHLYLQLAWLSSHVKPREIVEVLVGGDDFEEEQDDDQKGNFPSSLVTTSSASLDESRPTSCQELGVPSKRKKQDHRETEMTGCQQNVADALNKLRDEDELFLLSLLPSLKRLTIKRRMEVRMKFQQVLYEAEFED